MNTKIITALVIAFALVGLTGAASASSVTTGTYFDYITGGALAPGDTETDKSSIDFDFAIDGGAGLKDVTGGSKTITSGFTFEAGQGGIVKESLRQYAEIENTIGAVVNPKTGKEDRIFTTSDFAFVELKWQETEDGLTDIDRISKSATIDSDAYATDDVQSFYKKDVAVEDMSTMDGEAFIADDTGAMDPDFGTMKAGEFYFGSTSWAIVETEGDVLQEIFAGSGLVYEQSNWGKLENGGMIWQEAEVDQYVTVNVSP